MEWILVVLVYAGIMAKGDSVSLMYVPGWQSEEACKDAGKKLTPLVKATTKEVNFVCVRSK